MAAVEILKVGGRDFEVDCVLGSGGFSTVIKGIDVQTRKPVALKITYTDQFKYAGEKTQQQNQVHKEIKVMRQLSHAHVIRLLGYDLKSTYDGRSCIVMVQQLAPRRELFEYLMHSGLMGEQLSRTIFLQLVNALKMLHSKGIAHRDLKPENLLFDEKFKLKVADFGFAYVFQKKGDNKRDMQTELGTRGYMAPEILSSGTYDEKVDVFASGVIAFILVSGFPPFRETRDTDWWFNKIIKGKTNLFWLAHERKAKFSTEVKDLIQSMIQVDPAKRPTMEEIEKSDWCQGDVYDKDAYIKEMSKRHQIVKAARAKNTEKRDVFGEAIEKKVEALEKGKMLDIKPLITNTYREKFSSAESPMDVKRVLMQLGKIKKKVGGELNTLDLDDEILGDVAEALAEASTAEDISDCLGVSTETASDVITALNAIDLGLEKYDHGFTETLVDFDAAQLPAFNAEYQDPLECYNIKCGFGIVALAMQYYAVEKGGQVDFVTEKEVYVKCTFQIEEQFDVPTEDPDKWERHVVTDDLVVQVNLYSQKGDDNKVVFSNKSANYATAENFQKMVQEITTQTAIGSCMEKAQAQ